MILIYTTLTYTYTGGLFGTYIYKLNFLNEVDNGSLNEVDKINDGKTFEKFDDGVVFLGSLGYNLCSVISTVNSTQVETGWFSKEIKTV